MTSKQLQNIAQMEQILNQTQAFVLEAEQFLQKWQQILPNINKLSDYYYSNQWREDYNASNRGEIPPHIPHGVLSEDLVYNALGELHCTAIAYLKLVTQIIGK